MPGFYGTNSVKWLTRITLSDRRTAGPFTTRYYNDPLRDGAGRETGETTPVWSVAPESLIVSPAPDELVGPSIERGDLGLGLGGRRRSPCSCSHR